MALPSFGAFWSLVRTVDRLLALEAKQGQSLTDLQKQIDILSARMASLEAREEIVVAKSKGAARAAAMASATASMTERALRIGAIEERTRSRRPGTPRLDKN